MSYTVVTFSSHGRAIALALSLSGCGTNVVAPIGVGPQGGGGDAASGTGGAGAAGTMAAGGALALGLIAYFKLDEGSADEPALDSALQHTAMPVNDPPPTDDAAPVGFPNSGSRSFDGQGQYLRIANTD